MKSFDNANILRVSYDLFLPSPHLFLSFSRHNSFTLDSLNYGLIYTPFPPWVQDGTLYSAFYHDKELQSLESFVCLFNRHLLFKVTPLTI